MNALHLSQSDAVRALRRVMAVLILLLVGSGRAAAWRGSIVSRVSVASDATEANDTSHQPSISADGRHVAFYSDATNLVPDDTNGAGDIHVCAWYEEVPFYLGLPVIGRWGGVE
jgi:hypothetical protein